MTFEYEKRIIGLLIGYYRKALYQKTSDYKYTQKKMIVTAHHQYLELCNVCLHPCHHPLPICSNHTLIGIENGKVYEKECYYIGLTKNIHLNYSLSRKYNQALQEIALAILDCFDTCNISVIEETNQKINLYLKETTTLIYYPLILTFYQKTLSILPNQYSRDDDVIKLIEFLYPHFDEMNQKIAEIMLYYHFSHIVYDVPKLTMYLNKAAKDYQDYFFPVEFKIKQYIKSNRAIESYHYMQELLKEYASEANPYCALLIHFYLFLVIFDHNPSLIETQIKNLEEAASMGSDIFPEYLIRINDNEAARGYHLLGKHQLAIAYYKKAIAFNINMLKINFLLFAKSYEIENDLETIKSYLNESYFHAINHPFLRVAYTYYYRKYSKPTIDRALADELEDFIIDHFKGIIMEDSPHYKILIEELNILSSYTHAYKKLHSFTTSM